MMRKLEACASASFLDGTNGHLVTPGWRVQAKARFWTFIHENSAELLHSPLGEADFARQLSTIALVLLYPSYPAFEISEQVADVYRTMKRDAPDDFERVFNQQFAAFMQHYFSRYQ